MSKFRRTAKFLIQMIPRLLRRLGRQLSLLIQMLRRWVFHRLFVLRRQSSRGTAGFILPTAVMVILVVSLLTIAIVIRSTDRAKNASNYRINQVTLNASLPAIERAKAKMNQLFSDPNLPQGAPSDISLYNVLKSDTNYTLPDEVRLRIAYDVDRVGGIQPAPGQDIGAATDEISRTAWRYPVDTDNNGKYDSFTLYGIYFRTPPRTGEGFARTRTPLESRTPPQDNSGLTGFCAAAAGTSASLVGADGWYKSGANLKKSFYVYTATVPITNIQALNLPLAQFENASGNKGFTGLEYQQDRVKIPFGNNAVVYEDDLDLFSGTELKINGRIVANSNLIAASFVSNGNLRLYQVSSDESCFYEEENGKILVGGNVGFGTVGTTNVPAVANHLKNVTVDLFKGQGNDPQTHGGRITDAITASNKSVSNNADELAYNNQAYEERIAYLVNSIIDPDNNPTTPPPNPLTKDPNPVQEAVKLRLQNSVLDPEKVRREELEKWFRDRTRRVPYQEIRFGANAIVPAGTPYVEYGTDRLRPRDEWLYPTNVTQGGKVGSTAAGDRTKLTMLPAQLAATDPFERNNEERAGDRILTGNNLPASLYNSNSQKFESNAGEFTAEEGQQAVDGSTKWKQSGGTGDSTRNRYRKPQVSPSVNIGLTDRDGTWETTAAEVPENPLDDKGGLRIATGAGVYLPATPAFGGETANMSNVVWPDWMPVIPDAAKPGVAPIPAPPWLPDKSGDGTLDLNTDLVDEQNKRRPFLRMRAAAVYHYRYDNDNNRKTPAPPIACVSSYYDPTDRNTAQNLPGLPNVSGGLANFNPNIAPVAPPPPNQYAVDGVADGKSNNGVTYSRGLSSLGIAINDPQLRQQAELVYPNGRLVNPLLREAISKPFTERSLAENAAIDSTLCAFQILGLRGAIAINQTTLAGGRIPHGSIQEIAFLDSREVKQIEDDRGNPNGVGIPIYDDTSYSFQPPDDSQSVFLSTKTITNNPTRRSEYDLPIELRQPMEVRETVLDLDELRRQTITGIPPGTTVANLPNPEYILPNSGIVYVSRDDSLPDASAKRAQPPGVPTTWEKLRDNELATDRISATDFWLDPTRRPNGVLLINGKRLARGAPPNNQFRAEEKGLILATNLPVYIKAQPPGAGTPPSPTPGFNIHDAEEFTSALQTNWGNFYSRTAQQLNENFACRPNDPRLKPRCPAGDQWRGVSVLSDAMTLLSNTFRFGFRNEGDFDLRNNQVDNGFRNILVPQTGGPAIALKDEPNASPNIPGLVVAGKDPDTPNQRNDSIEEKRLFNGFFDNNFVTNGLSSNNRTGAFPSIVGGAPNGGYFDTQYTGQTTPVPLYSSYFNNFITPIQRRKAFAEYAMEMCRKLPVSECKAGDWVVGYDFNANSRLFNPTTGVPDTFTEGAGTIPADFNLNGTPGETLNESDVTTEQLLRLPPAQRLVARLGAGTTAQSPLDLADQRFARRVAFERANGGLVLTDLNVVPLPPTPTKPIPLGINSAGQVERYPYGPVTITTPAPNADIPRLAVGPNVNNALWFRGSRNPNQPWLLNNAPEDFTNPERWLSYENPKDTTNPQKVGYGGEADDWLLPDIPSEVTPITPAWTTNIAGQLNGPPPATLVAASTDTNDPADYSACIGGPLASGGGRSQLYTVTNAAPTLPAQQFSNAVCRAEILTAINSARTDLLAPIPGSNAVTLTTLATPPSRILSASSTNDINVFTLPATGIPASVTLTLDGTPNPNAIFVIKPPAGTDLIFDRVTVNLKNVDPNRVFWVSGAGMTFDGTNGPSNLAGNFLGNTVAAPANRLTIVPTNSITLNGGRLLGFYGSDISTALAAVAPAVPPTFSAISKQAQPLLNPVLQIHVPQRTNLAPAQVVAAGHTVYNPLMTHWLPLAPDNDTTFNLILAAGDSPGRTDEFNGALANFPRFMENWTLAPNNFVPVNIQGSFIQLKRSAFATAPYWQILDPGTGPTRPNGIYTGDNGTSSVFLGYPQRYRTSTGKYQNYEPPGRRWGFDVGLLSQLPDAFAKKLNRDSSEEPNEYYREASRDDDWVKTLLCAVQFNPPNALAINQDQRPQGFCP